MSDDMTEEDWENSARKYFPRCPLCAGKSLEFDIEFGSKSDYIICHKCHAKWEIDWKGEGYAIESITLVRVVNVERIGLKGRKEKPRFWLRMALDKDEVQTGPKIKEVIKEKEVIVKIRCPYCNHLYDETLNRCPHCAGSR